MDKFGVWRHSDVTTTVPVYTCYSYDVIVNLTSPAASKYYFYCLSCCYSTVESLAIIFFFAKTVATALRRQQLIWLAIG